MLQENGWIEINKTTNKHRKNNERERQRDINNKKDQNQKLRPGLPGDDQVFNNKKKITALKLFSQTSY